MLKWEQPERKEVGRKPGSGRWVEIVEVLKSNPGEWALIAENDWIQSARQTLLPRGCEVTTRGVNKPQPGKAEKIYARYVGGEDV